jgi:hypothetical protein
MRPLMIIVSHPKVKICLQLLNISINLFAESDLVKLLQDGLVEALANSIGLR